MHNKNKYRVYITGSLSGLAHEPEAPAPKKFYYVKVWLRGRAYFVSRKKKLGRAENAMPFEERQAQEVAAMVRKKFCNTQVYGTSVQL